MSSFILRYPKTNNNSYASIPDRIVINGPIELYKEVNRILELEDKQAFLTKDQPMVAKPR